MASSRPRPIYEDGIHDVELPSFRRMSDGGNVFPSRASQPPVPQMAPSLAENHRADFNGNIGGQRPPPVSMWGQNPYGLGSTAPFPPQYAVQDIAGGFSQHNPSTHDAQAAYLQKLIGELRNANNSKSQLITDLQIKVAVLENELKHATQAKDSVNNNLGFMVQAFSQASSMNKSSSSTLRLQDRATRDATEIEIQDRKDMEREIEELRKTNRRLKREAQENQEIYERGKLATPIKSEIPPERVRAREAAIQPKNVSFEIPNKGKKVDSHLDADWRPSSVPSKNDSQTPSRLSRLPAWNETSSENSPSTPVCKPDVSFASNSTTVPNTPVSPTQQPGDVQDEFVTVDELVYESDDTECREKKARHDAYFLKAPSPGVLKTGIETPGKYVGADSDFVPSGKTPWNKWSGLRPQEYLPNPFAPPTLQKLTSAISESPSRDEQGVWSSFRERNAALTLHQRDCHNNNDRRCPDFFKYGIRYVPTEDSSNFLRTVNISNLPKDVSLRDVIARVRGGELFGSFLCNTLPIIGSMTVCVIFKHAKSASDYIKFCSEHPLTFFGDSEPVPRTAIVTLLDTPTYPSNHTRINEQSRCVCVKNFPAHLYPYELQESIARNNGFRAEALLEFFIDKDRSLYMQFASIDAAGSTLGFFNNRAAYRDLGLVAIFWDDPCDGSIDELLVDESDSRKWSKPTFVFGVKKYGSNSSSPEKEMIGRERAAAAEHQRRAEEIKNGGEQRKQLLSLTNQTVEIPSFSGKGIGGSSWADEVIEEQEPSQSIKPGPTFIPTTPLQQISKEDLSFSSTDSFTSIDINRLMADRNHECWETRNPPPGLAASKYATRIPSFEPLSQGHTPSPLSASQNNHPTEHHRSHIVLDYGEDVQRPKFGAHAEKVGGDEEKSPMSSSSGDSATAIIRRFAKVKSREMIEDMPELLPKKSSLRSSTEGMRGFEVHQGPSINKGEDIEELPAPLIERSTIPSSSSLSLAQLPASLSPSPSVFKPVSSPPQRVLSATNPDEIQLPSSSASSPTPGPSTPLRVLTVTNPDEIQLDSDADSDSELEEGEIKEG